ncbi:MAG: hypothetical protein WCJ45_07735 [bacterium]
MVGQTVSIGTGTVVVPTKYVFTKAFNSGEYGEGVKVLQNLLTTLHLYT